MVLPRLSAFLSDRLCQPPAYDEGGRLQLARARYVMLSGVLRDIPAFREAEELRLRAAVGDAAAAGQLRRVIESGDAAVYEVVERK